MDLKPEAGRRGNWEDGGGGVRKGSTTREPRACYGTVAVQTRYHRSRVTLTAIPITIGYAPRMISSHRPKKNKSIWYGYDPSGMTFSGGTSLGKMEQSHPGNLLLYRGILPQILTYRLFDKGICIKLHLLRPNTKARFQVYTKLYLLRYTSVIRTDISPVLQILSGNITVTTVLR